MGFGGGTPRQPRGDGIRSRSARADLDAGCCGPGIPCIALSSAGDKGGALPGANLHRTLDAKARGRVNSDIYRSRVAANRSIAYGNGIGGGLQRLDFYACRSSSGAPAVG
ncbi:MAG: hypothetical protein KIPDCIKN_03905 [Haliscomenobacter sp.]|nr:hypothetical protein [Haliscomenobacter sp.]